jgi:protein-disulfide isomerase
MGRRSLGDHQAEAGEARARAPRRATVAGAVHGPASVARPVLLWLVLGVFMAGEAAAQQAALTRDAVVAAVERAPGATKGAHDARVAIVEFSDFQCGYCRKFWTETLPKLEAEYVSTGKVRFVYRHLVVLGPASQRAAEAAECAGEQGRFWTFHDALFERRGRLPDARAVHAMGLDVGAFDACLESGRGRQRIASDSAAARALGVTGTPAFLINGRLLIGAHPFEAFEQVLDPLVRTPSETPSGRR